MTKEQLRERAHIPSRKEFPYTFCVGWRAQDQRRPPQYSFNPVSHTVDKFAMDRENQMRKTRTRRVAPAGEPSITDGRSFNRVKGVCEYEDLTRLTNERWNRAFHRGMNQNDRVFYRKSGATTCFVDCMLKQGYSIAQR